MKIIQRLGLALLLGAGLIGCNNDLGYEPPTQKLNSSEVSSEVTAPTGDNLKSLSTLKHKTDLSFNGHEDNLQSVNGIASKAASPSSGLTAPALMAGMSGSNISYCVYNSEDRSIYLNTEGTLQKTAYQKDWIEVPSHTSGCLDKVTFDGTDIHPVKVSFSADGSSPFTTYLHYRQDNQIISGDKQNQGYFGYFADYNVDAKGVWQADNDKEFTVSDAAILKGNGFGVQDNTIVNNYRSCNVWGFWLGIALNLLAILLSLGTGFLESAGVFAQDNTGITVHALFDVDDLNGVKGIIRTSLYKQIRYWYSFGADETEWVATSSGGSIRIGTASKNFLPRIFKTLIYTTLIGGGITLSVLSAGARIVGVRNFPSPNNDYSRTPDSLSALATVIQRGGKDMSEIGYYDEKANASVHYQSTLDSRGIKSINGSDLFQREDKVNNPWIYTNVIKECFNSNKDYSNCGDGSIAGDISENITAAEISGYKKYAIRTAMINEIGSADAPIQSNFAEINAKYELSKKTLDDMKNQILAGIPGTWKTGTNASFDPNSLTFTDLGDSSTGALPTTLSYGDCKFGSSVNYVPVPQDVKANILPMGPYRSVCKNIQYDPQNDYVGADCPDAASLAQAKTTGNLSGATYKRLTTVDLNGCTQLDENLQCVSRDALPSGFPTLAKVMNQCNVAVTGSGSNQMYSFSCWNSDKLQVSKLATMRASLINVGKDVSYDSTKNSIVVATNLLPSAKILACSEYLIPFESTIRPGTKILATYGAKFVGDSFESMTGLYSLDYTAKDGVKHTLTSNVYQSCSIAFRGLELGLLPNSNGQAPEFELHCLLPKSGPKLYSSSVPYPKESSPIVFISDGTVGLSTQYLMYENTMVTLNFTQSCRYGSGVRIEDLRDAAGNLYRTLTCKSYLDKDIDTATGPTGAYQGSCTNIYYQNTSGYLNALCKKNDGSYNPTRLDTMFLPSANIVNNNGVLMLQ